MNYPIDNVSWNIIQCTVHYHDHEWSCSTNEGSSSRRTFLGGPFLQDNVEFGTSLGSANVTTIPTLVVQLQ